MPDGYGTYNKKRNDLLVTYIVVINEYAAIPECKNFNKFSVNL